MLLLLTSLLTGCDEVSTEPADVPSVESEATTEAPPDSGSPVSEEATEAACEVDTGAVSESIFFCLDGMTCPSCDAALPLTISAHLPCVVDGEITYEDPPGVQLSYHPEVVTPADIVSVIESSSSPYTVTCTQEN